jgi:hypothetical protein
MDTGGYSPGVKRPRREADNSLLSNVEFKNGGAILPLPIRPAMVLNLLSTGRTLPVPLMQQCTWTESFACRRRHACYLLGLFFNSEDRLHGITSHKMVLDVVTAERTANLARIIIVT